MSPAAPTLRWEASGPCDPHKGSLCCWFDFNGRRYFLKKAADGSILRLSKRERSNGRGVYYSPLVLTGAAARKVLSAVLPTTPEQSHG